MINGQTVTQDVGAWDAMPHEHYQALMETIQELQQAVEKLKREQPKGTNF